MFSIQGKLISTGAGDEQLGRLTILALDTLDGNPAVMATTTVAADGTYSIPLELGDVNHLFRGDLDTEVPVIDRAATLYVNILRNGITLAQEELTFTLRDLLDGTRYSDFLIDFGQAEGERQGPGGSPRRKPPGRGCRYFVRGALRRSDGTPVPSVQIEVLEKRVRREVLLGATATGREGAYELVYGSTPPCDPARSDKSIFVRALDDRGEEIARSTVHCDVAAEVRIDLVVGNEELRGAARSTEIWRKVEGHLDDAKLEELSADDVEFLACKVREDVVQVAYLARAAQLAAATDVTREAFFAFASAGLPTTLTGILGHDRETQREALERAAAENMVPPWREGEIEEILDALNETMLDLSVPRDDPEASLLGQLLLTGRIARSLPRRFIEAYLTREGSVEEFWRDFRSEHGTATTDTVQFTLAIGSLTGNHIPLVEALQAKRKAEEIESARDLATFTAADWLELLTRGSTPPGAPAAIPGEDENTRNQNYANTLVRVFEDAFPTMAVRGALERVEVLEKVVEFFDLNPAFDLGSTRIDAFLRDNPNLPTGDINDLRRDLKLVQRLDAVAPRFERGKAVTTLLGEGMISAQQIYKMGYAAFRQRFETLLGTSDTREIWGKAVQASARVATLLGRYGSPFNLPRLPVIRARILEPEEDGFPDIEALFGAQEFCACEHCRSIFSPAAYLTDLLKFLGDRSASNPQNTLLDVLKARREDIVHILLNCQNANTVMPTIDLVNEILERRVSGEVPAEWPQTTWTSAELRAHPEHLHQPAYDVLKAAVHPFILPFDLRLEEARLYLDHLGVRLADLLDAIRGHDADHVRAIALETLRLSPAQGDILEDDTINAWPYWGMSDGTFADELNADVRLFLKQASLTYAELLELLHVSYVMQPTNELVQIEHAEGKPCTLEDARFNPRWPRLQLSRAHRFVRLWRRTGWTVFDLDAAFRALASVNDPLSEDRLDEGFLLRLAGVFRLIERWPRLAKLELLSWFGLLDTYHGSKDAPSFYEQVFLDRTLNPENENFELDEDGTELEGTEALDLITTDGAVLQAALNLREEEVKALVDALEVFVGEMPQRNLSWLSRLHRRASLSRALGLSIHDLLRLISLIGMEPFDDGETPTPNVAHTRAFIERVDRVRATRFTLAELDYLLRHRFEPSQGVALLRDRAQEIFVELIRGLQDIAAETSREADASTPALTVLGDRLGEVIEEAFIQPALQLIEREPIGDVDPEDLRDELRTFLAEEEVLQLFEEDALGQSESDPRSEAQRAEDTLMALLAHIRSERMSGLVIQHLSTAVGLESAAGEALLRRMELGEGDGVTIFLNETFVTAIDFEEDAEAIKTQGFPTLSPADALNDHFQTLERLFKAAKLVQRLRLPVRHLEWLLEHAETLDLLDPIGLPFDEPIEGPAPQWLQWEKLARVVLLRDEVFRDPDALFEVLLTEQQGGMLDENGQAMLVEGTGWDAEDLSHLVVELAVDVDAVQTVDGLERLARAFRMLRRLGVSAERVTEWATTDVTVLIAQSIKNATRSKHPPEQWPGVIGPLRDTLREQQRYALVAQVLAQSPGLRGSDDLLGELLIDVQGAACQRTSRIVQASASVQLFVQCLLMNLEAPEKLDDASAREWAWRKYYRVWEANRKVYLYPENFIEPELRDDQSSFFRELAADLLDADLTEERAERAYIDYVRKLREVARLQVAGVYHELEYDESGQHEVLNVLHVFARTLSPPYRYYYRKWVDESYWTAWEEVPLGIDHPTVMPVVMNRRLMLLWPMLAEKTETIPRSSSEDPRRFLEIQLGLSEYLDGAWTQTELSEETILTANSTKTSGVFTQPEPAPAGVFFETRHLASGDLMVVPFFLRQLPDTNNSVFYFSTEHAFHLFGGDGKLAVSKIPTEARNANIIGDFPKPNESDPHYQDFASGKDGQQVLFPKRNPTNPNNIILSGRVITEASPFKVLVPRHNTRGNAQVRFLCEDPFFYHDDKRSFFVRPRDSSEHTKPLGSLADRIKLSELNSFNLGLYIKDIGEPQPLQPQPPQREILSGSVHDGVDHQYSASESEGKDFWFFPFQHPYVSRMLGVLNREGISGLLDPPEDGDNKDLRRQSLNEPIMAQEPGKYEPANIVRVRPRDQFEFDHHEAYSLYNWELFFHAPLLVAERLRDAQRFEAAQRWYHYVFDPTDSSDDEAPQRFWKIKPFYNASQPTPIAEQLEALSYTGTDAGKRALREAAEAQIAQWRNNPFNPHLLARLRLPAYQRTTVMKYLDNLIAWGDHLFQQDTRETIGEALQLYILAAQLLGPRPLRLEARTPAERTFDELEEHLDALANALVELENLTPPGNIIKDLTIQPKAVDGVVHPGPKFTLNIPPPPPPDGFLQDLAIREPGVGPIMMIANLAFVLGDIQEPDPEASRALYFCIPPNDKLLGYWDKVADRLFKIRNCLNIEGIRRELPLFEPPIDPALLVKATAAGIDLASAIAALNAPRPHYRFYTVIPVAKELAAEVRALGQALLTALERKDAEELAELRATHEVRTVETAERVLEDRVREARQNIAVLQAARDGVVARGEHYERLKDDGRLAAEDEGIEELDKSIQHQRDARDEERLLGAITAFFPDVGVTLGLAAGVTTTMGGSMYTNWKSSVARRMSANAGIDGSRSSRSLANAGFERATQPWDLEIEQAEKETERIDKEIIAAQIRLEIALEELDNHRQEIAQARERETFLKHRFTRSELYGWMASEVGRVYYQAYQLAYDVAKRAERTYQFELATKDTSFIQFGYWDNQRMGLLAGDKLLHDIRRMETAHLQNHRRELELTKNVSLATLDPVALTLLRETGESYLRVPELLFDLDHPGHFLRRLKSVSVSVPSKTGQLAEVPLTLTLVSSAIRKSPTLDADALVEDPTSGIQQIATLAAEEDDGLFNRNFDDARYLPFEGRGAVSLWRIELPQNFRQFDYGQISDVLLRLSFTARQGGEVFQTAVQNQIDEAMEAYVRHESSFGEGLVNGVSVRKVFPDDWNRFVDPPDEEAPRLELDMSAKRFPLRFHGGEIRANRLWLLAVFRDAASPEPMEFNLELPTAADGSATVTISNVLLNSPLSAEVPRMRMGEAVPTTEPTAGVWRLDLVGDPPEMPESLEDLVIMIQYTVE